MEQSQQRKNKRREREPKTDLQRQAADEIVDALVPRKRRVVERVIPIEDSEKHIRYEREREVSVDSLRP